jgi:hypothetical protein
MTILDPNVVVTHLTQGLRERAADLGDEERFQERILATISVLPQRRSAARFSRRTNLVLVAAALLGLVAGSLAVGASLRQRPVPLGDWIAVAADARAGAGFLTPLDPMDVEFGPGPQDIFLIGPGVAPRPAFPSPQAGVERACPAFSPDGLRFMHLETSGDGAARYIISRLDESGLPALTEIVITPTTSPDSEPSCAQWSSDGRTVAYVAPDEVGHAEMHVRDIDGGEVIVDPTPNTGTSGGFAWSPVAPIIAYVDDGLFIVPLDGSPARRLMPSTLEETIDWVTWAPDGSTLDVGIDLYDTVEEDGGSTGSQTGREIRRIRLDGTIEAALVTTGSREWPTVWSPDGQTIALGTDEGILLTDRSGRAKGVLPGAMEGVRGRMPQPHPLVWSADGRSVLAVVPADSGGSTLALLSTDLLTVSQLTPITRAFEYVDRESVSWQPSAVAGR